MTADPVDRQAIILTSGVVGEPGAMRRRDFIAALGGAAAMPLAAQERVRRVGVLLAAYTETDRAGQARIAAFRDTLQELGWREDRNIRLDYRWSGGSTANAKTLAADLVQSAPDAIVVAGDPALTQLHKLPSAIPIVFTQVSEPVDSGFVASLARPGGNATGFMNFEYSVSGKWLELLKQIAPSVTRVAVLRDPNQRSGNMQFAAIQAVAPSLGMEVNPLNSRDAGEIERSIAAFARTPNGGLIATSGAGMVRHRHVISALASRHKLPAVYSERFYAVAGGLIAYGPDQVEQFRLAAGYVDRVLKGEEPADLPVQAPTKYELAINLKTAKALGLTVPPPLLARADEVIE